MKSRTTARYFTLAEALAILAIAAIVLPITAEAIFVTRRAAQTALRTETAIRLADATLHELVLTGDWQTSEGAGEFEEWPGMTWELAIDDWSTEYENAVTMTRLTVTVFFPVRQQEQNVSVTTLVTE